ncbi:MAG: lysophospholipid acyltransferase family protein [Fimbriimonas sp.]
MKHWWRRVRPNFIPKVMYWIVRIVVSSMRVRAEGLEKSDSFPARIYCGWHGKSVLFGHYFRNRGLWVLVSHSNDGEMQARIFRRLGYRVIRGSTGRGGVKALIEAIRVLREGGSMAMTPDGPRGPSGIVQPGVVSMAQKSGAALVPVGISARPCRYASSWDRYMAPLPFGRGLMIFGDPILVPANATAEEFEACRKQLEDRIHELEAEALSRV